jgi:hypothetical protein
MKNLGRFLLKLSVPAFALATIFCTAVQAQNVSEASFIDFGGGVTLNSVVISTAGPQQDPVDVFLTLTGITGNSTSPNSRTVFARGVPSSSSTPAGNTAGITALAAYAVLAGTVTPNYASHVTAATDQVSVTFQDLTPYVPSVPVAGTGGAGAGKANFNAFAITKSVDVASPSFFKQVVGGTQPLVAQFGLANPLAPAPSAACNSIATRFDIDSNDNLLVYVFQNNGAPYPNVTVTLFVSVGMGAPVQYQSVSGANGEAPFNGPSNTVALTAQTTITDITLQFTNAGTSSVCAIQLQGNPCSITTDLAAAVRNGNARELFAWLKKETELSAQTGTSFQNVPTSKSEIPERGFGQVTAAKRGEIP